MQVAGTNPVVALFPKDGTTPNLSAGFTSTYSGTAAIYVTGMTPGNYSLTIGGVSQASKVADSQGVIKMTGTAGTYAFTDTDSPVTLSIGTTTLSDATLSVSYFSQLLGVGGTIPYTWAITSGALPTGLSLNTSSGAISGIPTATGAFSITTQITDAAAGTATQVLGLNVGAGVIPIGVTSASSNPAILSSDSTPSVAITASTTGGATPFAWTLPTNTAGCSPTTGSGNTFTAVCTTPGAVDFLVTDSASNSADITFTVQSGIPPVSSSAAAGIFGKAALRGRSGLGSGTGPVTVTWSTLTSAQWAALTSIQWAGLIP